MSRAFEVDPVNFTGPTQSVTQVPRTTLYKVVLRQSNGKLHEIDVDYEKAMYYERQRIRRRDFSPIVSVEPIE